MVGPLRKRAFTLIELAIVIVIAGILAAVAVPIYQSLVEDSKWSEGKAAASTVRSALDVYITENNGIPAAIDDTLDNIDTVIGVNQADFNKGKYFRADDIRVIAPASTSSGASTYIIRVTGGNTAEQGAPDGVYEVNQIGSTTGP